VTVRRQLGDFQRQALLAAQFLGFGYVERPHVHENMDAPLCWGGELQLDTVDLGRSTSAGPKIRGSSRIM